MDILFILIPVSLGLGTIGLLAFLWTLKHHQYEDPNGDASRILSDTYDQSPGPPPNPATTHKSTPVHQAI